MSRVMPAGKAEKFWKNIVKTSTLALIVGELLALMAFESQAQPSVQSAAQDSTYAITESGADYRVWQKTNYETTASGDVIPHAHRVVELATGLNFTNSQTGLWMPSKEEIDILPNGGAAATNG